MNILNPFKKKKNRRFNYTPRYYSGKSSSRTTYNNILDSYDTQSSYRGSSNSFLQFHSSTTGYRYKTAYGKKTTNSQFESTEIDVSEKIALAIANVCL